MINCIWDTRVRKRNLRGSEKQNEHEKKNSEIELNCIRGWQLALLRKNG